MIFFLSEIVADNTAELLRYANKITGKKHVKETSIKKEEKRICVIKINNAQVNKIARNLRDLFPDLKITVNEGQKMLMFQGSAVTELKVRKLCEELDKIRRQVRLEITIMEISYRDYLQYENIFSAMTNGGMLGYDFRSGKVKSEDDYEGFWQALMGSGQAKIVAKPSVVIIDQEEALVKVGDRIPYVSTTIESGKQISRVSFLDAGIELKIWPEVVQTGNILVSLEATVANVKLWKEYRDNAYPIISSRKTKTRVKIVDDETLVLAELLDEQKQRHNRGVPGLKDLWFVGGLFGAETEEVVKTDIVFMIRRVDQMLDPK